MKTMSKSKVLCYASCPRMFKFNYILRLPTQMHPAAIIGINIHDMAEKFFDKVDMSRKDIKEHYQEIVNELLPNMCEKTKLYADNFITLELQRRQLANDNNTISFYKPTYREVKAEHDGIKGIIDRIDQLPDGTYALIDYKTGQPKNIKHYMYELSLYAWLAEKTLYIKVSKVGIAKLKNKGKILELFDITQTDMEQAVAITKNVKQLIKDEEFDMKKGSACYYCPYKNICDKLEERKERIDGEQHE